MKKVLGIYKAPPAHWVGDGFPAKTLFSYQSQGQSVSPFLLLDHAGPQNFSSTQHKRGVGEHPHRGFETVTIVYHGEVAHKDSTGEQGLIGPGDVQWMTAGSGILHEEFHSSAFAESGGKLEMVQLWVNLPKREKMTPPKYQTITAPQIPSVELVNQRGQFRVIAGELMHKGKAFIGPAQTHTPMLVMDGQLNAGEKYSVPVNENWTATLVVRSGQMRVNGEAVSTGETIILSAEGKGLEMISLNDSEFLILSGEPISEPIVGYGPFVMNYEAEIRQAMLDFNSGKFGQLVKN